MEFNRDLLRRIANYFLWRCKGEIGLLEHYPYYTLHLGWNRGYLKGKQVKPAGFLFEMTPLGKILIFSTVKK